MPKKTNNDPQPGHPKTVIIQVLEPLMLQISVELGHPLSARVEVVRDDRVIKVLPPIRSDTQTSKAAQSGDVRLRFRDTFFPGRQLFFLDAVFQGDPRTPSFAGFRVRGRVTSESGTAKAGYSAWAMKHNDFSWAAWI